MGSRLRCRVHITELLSHLVKLRECIKIQHNGSRALCLQHFTILSFLVKLGMFWRSIIVSKWLPNPLMNDLKLFVLFWIIQLPNELVLEGSRILARAVSEEAEKDNKRTSGDIIFQIKGRPRRCFQNERHLACPSSHLVGQVSAGEARVSERALEQERSALRLLETLQE